MPSRAGPSYERSKTSPLCFEMDSIGSLSLAFAFLTFIHDQQKREIQFNSNSVCMIALSKMLRNEATIIIYFIIIISPTNLIWFETRNCSSYLVIKMLCAEIIRDVSLARQTFCQDSLNKPFSFRSFSISRR